MAWQRFVVKLKGEEPFEVQTNARDMVAIVMDPSTPRPMDIVCQMAHNAAKRERRPVPRDYVGFLEALEAMPEAVDDDELGEVDELLDPTQPGH